MIALFIGRFQPFHLGHLSVIQDLQKRGYLVKIGIGSTQEVGTKKNPYSYEQRKQMITNSATIKHIFNIPDIPDDNAWVDHVNVIVGSYDIIVTGNTLVTKLFKAKSIPVEQVTIHLDIQATKIREMIQQSKDISQLVPAGTLKVILG